MAEQSVLDVSGKEEGTTVGDIISLDEELRRALWVMERRGIGQERLGRHLINDPDGVAAWIEEKEGKQAASLQSSKLLQEIGWTSVSASSCRVGDILANTIEEASICPTNRACKALSSLGKQAILRADAGRVQVCFLKELAGDEAIIRELGGQALTPISRMIKQIVRQAEIGNSGLLSVDGLNISYPEELPGLAFHWRWVRVCWHWNLDAVQIGGYEWGRGIRIQAS